MKKKKNLRKKTVRKYRTGIIILLLVCFMTGVILNKDFIFSFIPESTGINESAHIFPLISKSTGDDKDAHIIPDQKDWNLIVVNRWNKIPEDVSISLTELSNGQKVDSRIYPYLQEMFDAARKDGIYPFVREGYRTTKEQQDIFNEKIQAYMNEGYSRAEAEKTAKEWVAVPGTSEHQLSIAVDINADKAHSASDEVYAWLAKNAHRYGFILRYPQDKEKITGTSYEPWHYRYVGIKNAGIIYEKQMCLEEFVESIK